MKKFFYKKLESKVFFSKGHFRGILWMIPAILISNINDILMRLCGSDLPPQEVTFFRYFFSILILLPVAVYNGKKTFHTKRIFIHVIRSALLFGAISLWIKGLTMSSLVVGGVFAQTTQIFVVLMAFLLLKEAFSWQKTLSVLVGFFGVLIVSVGESSLHLGNFLDSFYKMENSALFFLLSSLLFAISDIINKQIAREEPILSMVFYVALGAMLFSLYPAILCWKTPSWQNLLYLLFLGVGGNSLLLFLLQSFKETDVSNLVGIRYMEIVSAGMLGYFFFSEIPSYQTFLGAFFILISITMILCTQPQTEPKT